MLSKEVSCRELKAEMENCKEDNARKSSLLTSLRDRVQELEEESAALSSSKIRTEITAHTTVKENQELKKKVVQLDEKLQYGYLIFLSRVSVEILASDSRTCL